MVAGLHILQTRIINDNDMLQTNLECAFLWTLKIDLNGHLVSGGQFLSFIALQATLSVLELKVCIIHWVCILQAGAHLKWLLQCEGHRAETRRCAVPAEVLGTVIAWIFNVYTGVINLKRRNRLD